MRTPGTISRRFISIACGCLIKIMRRIYYSVEKILYPIVASIGIPVNLVAILILSRGKCGLSTSTTRYLLAMATADLLVIISEVILRQVNYHYFPMNILDITGVCIARRILRRVSTDFSVWFTVTFTFDRFVAICCQTLKTKYCTGKTATLVLVTTGILFCLKNVPFCFAYMPRVIVNNRTWFCQLKPSYFTDPAWVVLDWVDRIATPLVPFVLILLFNALTVRLIWMSGRVRQGLRGRRKGESPKDTEMESRRRSVLLLFTLSGSFILLWMTNVVEFFYYQITGSDVNESEYVFHQVGSLLKNVSCCTNMFIYVATQSRFREELKSAVKYPVRSAFHFLKKYTPWARLRVHCRGSTPGCSE
ncbi:probable G-protein coupled receptor 139 [Narcine bancroftii]|uniref:probable G-protein coupled receptor 139 n=1 Tax=Narcine bancroftii TaxID=1343680 RepID=UPI0038310948